MKKIYTVLLLAMFATSCESEIPEPEPEPRDLTGKKVITIGDSLTALCGWQPYLVEWLGIDWSEEETTQGTDGHRPMAVGGTWVKPINENSIYMRAFDAHYYNPDIIFLYVASNDIYKFWVSDENKGKTPEEIARLEPAYRENKVNSQVSTVSAYKGIIEQLQESCPQAEIYLIGMMRIYIVPGMNPTGEFADMYPSPRFPTMDDVLEYEMTERYPRLEIIREVAELYDLPLIDLWEMSGITNENAASYYYAPAGDCTQVHPNDAGNKRVAECIRDFMLGTGR